MALGEIFQQVAQTLMVFRADTSDLKTKMRDVQGEEKKLVQAQLDAVKAQNDRYESWSKWMTKANVTIQLTSKAIGIAGEAWKEYEKKALAAGGADAEKARKFRGALNEMDRSMDKVKESIGRIVVALEPLVRLAARLVNITAEVIDMIPGGDGRFYSKGYNILEDKLGIQRGTILGMIHADERAAEAQSATDLIARTNAIAGLGLVNAGSTVAQGARVRRGRRGAVEDNTISSFYDVGRDTKMDPFNLALGQSGYGGMGDVGLYGPLLDQVRETQALAEQAAQRKSFLEGAFGTLEEVNGYQMAFEALSGALTSAFDAWTEGANLTSEALKGLAHNAMKGVAMQMFAEAVKHGAYALGSLAFGIMGDPKGFAAAATHAKAAAAFGAGAALFGAGARATAAGGGAAASVGSGGGAASVYRPVGAPGGESITVVVGDIFAANNPRAQAGQVARAIRMARKDSADDRGIRR